MSEGEDSKKVLNSLRRVKVYELNEEGQWIDKGTGQVSCIFVEVSDLKNMSFLSFTFVTRLNKMSLPY